MQCNLMIWHNRFIAHVIAEIIVVQIGENPSKETNYLKKTAVQRIFLLENDVVSSQLIQLHFAKLVMSCPTWMQPRITFSYSVVRFAQSIRCNSEITAF